MSDYSRYGGQAIVEGVMMRSPHFFSVACRRANGEIMVRTEPVSASIIGKLGWLNKPVLRGSLTLVDALVLGYRALAFSAAIQAADITSPQVAATSDTEAAPDPDADGPSVPRTVRDIHVGIALIGGLALGLGLFVALPTLFTQLLQHRLGVTNGYELNVVDGVIRLSMFLGYLSLISLLPHIQRVFQYHGAEHKAINTLESGSPLTVENGLLASRIHPRCGTSFIIVVLLASVVVHSVFPRPDNYFIRLALHLALVPVVAGISYELIRLAGKYRNIALLSYAQAPGLWTQRLTTREPDAEQIEVAIAALDAVLERESEAAVQSTTEVAAVA